MPLEIEVQTGELFTSQGNLQALIMAIAGHQLFDAIDVKGQPVILNTASIVWIKER